MNRSRTSVVMTLLRKGVTPSQIVTILQIRKALKNCREVLDVGCGPDSALSLLGFDRLVGIEGYAPSVEAAKKNRTHHEIVQGDVRHLETQFQAGQFDACVALDLIEHLTKEDGRRLMANMEKLARRKVVFLTPNGFLPQSHAEQADLQEHLSGWEPLEMRSYGYTVAGVLGPKGLRGPYHHLRRKPGALWGVISLLGHFLYTRWIPARAAAILCVKVE
jgi:SAM-dependent methyltransferase